MSDLGQFIKKYRKEHGNISMRQLADKCGLSHGYINKLEKGIDTRNGKPVIPTIETINKLSKGMSTPVEKLLFLSGIQMEYSDSNNQEFNCAKEPIYYYADDSFTKKDEKDIAKKLEEIIHVIDTQRDLTINDNNLDDDTRELLIASIERTLRQAKLSAKEKFAPNKYKNK